MTFSPLRLSLRTDPVGGSVDSAPNLADFSSLKLTSRRLVLLIHGYNNTEEQAKASYAGFFSVQQQLAGMGQGDDFACDRNLVEVLWHGDDPSEGALFYPTAIGEAQHSARILAAALVTAAGGVPFTLDLVAHSLGARLAFEFLRFATGQPALDIRRIVVMAGAVPLFMLEDGSDPNSLRSVYERSSSAACLSLYSQMDSVLSAAFPLGQSIAPGHEGFFPVALGHERWWRPESLRGFSQQENRGANHSEYWGHVPGRDGQARFASAAIREFLEFPVAGERQVTGLPAMERVTDERISEYRSLPDRTPEARWV